MRQDLIENPVFLRYYERWQADQTSVVFAPLAEILRNHGMIDDAINIVEEGLKHHPDLVSGRIVLARAYLSRGKFEESRAQAFMILGLMPNHSEARAILQEIVETEGITRAKPVVITVTPEELHKVTQIRPDPIRESKFDIFEDEPTEDMPITEVPVTVDELEFLEEYGEGPSDHEAWHTVTMAKILASQGHFSRARKIFRKILEREPNNEEAKVELGRL
jgi:tetratricopeptide (TPR) repeat protein